MLAEFDHLLVHRGWQFYQDKTFKGKNLDVLMQV